MRIARFEHQGQLHYGIVDDDGDGEAELVKLFGDPIIGVIEPLDERVPLAEARLLAPVIPRSKVVAFGRNYAEHARELGNEVPDAPMMFLKPNTSVIGPDHPIVLPRQSQHVEHEVELAVVIGKVARNVPASDADDVIFGYTVANDVTARDLQAVDGQWTRAKGFDSFCPLGPWIDTEFNPSDALISCHVNNALRQMGSTKDMHFKPEQLLIFISSIMTLEPGDLILTGTPAGVGPLTDGDFVSVHIDGLGTLVNPVRKVT